MPVSGDVEHSAVWDLDSTPEAVSVGRRLAAEHAAPLLEARQLESLRLLISELLTNAVRHGKSETKVRLAIEAKSGYLCVRVTDGGPGLVPRPGATAPSPGAGFGLFLVEQLARRWGVTREDGRTRVWFELDFVEQPRKAA